ncbi:hypothetical protein EB796_003900 [Bugula neritina]|uniref:Uncharacterized protein n=1 Tax=Bugula neritina TaxID=10212 RepID=A0A7J7KGK1_BUGNE|nr:hypothetical protein EB796_003900 [Bugula neritina]
MIISMLHIITDFYRKKRKQSINSCEFENRVLVFICFTMQMLALNMKHFCRDIHDKQGEIMHTMQRRKRYC